jgi:glycosyltransferase involved in cell wall biosynthesis
MKILVVHPKIYVYGGAEVLLVRLCNYLSGKGIENTLLTTSIIPEVQKDLGATNILVKKPPNNSMNIVGYAFFLWKTVRTYSAEFDLVNVHNFPSELSAFLSSRPVVWMCNEPEIHLLGKSNNSIKLRLALSGLRPFEKYVVKHYIDKVVVADNFNATRFEKLYGIEPHIDNYGIDCEFFSQPGKIRTKHEMRLDNKFVILHVGMLTPFKNQLESLRTIKKLKNKIPNLLLVMAGHWIETYKEQLDEYIRLYNLEDLIAFTGHISREKLRDFYYACDVLIHPIKSQGGWLSPFEALCAGKPVVVSQDMTASDILSKENIGIVSNQYDDVVMDIYRNPDKYAEMANKGAIWVKENLTWDKFCDGMVTVFDNVLNGAA